MTYKFSMGIDVSKSWLDIVLLKEGESVLVDQIDNKPKQIHSFFKKVLTQHCFTKDECIVCMEHTGIYNHWLVKHLIELEMKVCVENAVQIKRSMGLQRGKNDRVDAHRIAEYASRFSDKLRLYKPKDENLERLRTLTATRKRLVQSKVCLQQPVDEVAQFTSSSQAKWIKEMSERSIKALQTDIESIEQQIAELIKTDSKLTMQMQLITSVPGVGDKTAVELLIRTNGFTDFQNAKQLACYAGVAPFSYQSGSSINGRARVNHQANKSLKSLLHLCAMSVIRNPGELKDFYLRKVAEGKNKMSVLNAIRNKLIHRIFAVVKNQTMYQKNYNHSLVLS